MLTSREVQEREAQSTCGSFPALEVEFLENYHSRAFACGLLPLLAGVLNRLHQRGVSPFDNLAAIGHSSP